VANWRFTRITQPRLPAVLMSTDESQPDQLRSVRSVLLHLFIVIIFVTLRNYKRLSKNGILYLLASAAGAVIEIPSDSASNEVMPLRLLFTPVERVPQPEKTKILGRVVVLLFILAGLIGTLFLVIRRSVIVGILYSQADIQALFCCLSGIAIVVSSLTIQLCEGRWHVSTSTLPAPQADDPIRKYGWPWRPFNPWAAVVAACCFLLIELVAYPSGVLVFLCFGWMIYIPLAACEVEWERFWWRSFGFAYSFRVLCFARLFSI